MPSRFFQKFTNWKWRSLVKVFLIFILSSILLFILLDLLFPLPSLPAYSKIIRNEKGEMINVFLTKDEKWRLELDPGHVSPLLKKTIIAKEDRYFFSHPGVNPFAICRAAAMNLLHFRRTSGASTITMQVARALEPRKRTFWAKSVEIFRAFQLEKKYSKQEILSLYLGLAPYGGNIEGVRTAALLYFGKDADHLSLAEITALSIIPNRPSSLVIGKNNERILEERNKWLKRFAAEGVFSEKEIADALAEPLEAHRGSFPHYLPHLSNKLRAARATEVRTFIDLEMQIRLEQLTSEYIQAQKLNRISNASIIVVDNRTRKVLAYVGSAGFLDTASSGQVNGAAAVRQPGSTLKPLLYGLCMDKGLLTPSTILNDVPVNYQGYAPENYDRNFHGPVSMAEALGLSLNIPAVRSLNTLGLKEFEESLVECRFNQVRKDQQKLGLSMVLGGCGASLEELTGLYCAFANEGIYQPLRYQSTDGEGKPRRILSEESAYLITDILSKVGRPDFPLNWTATAHMPKIAWKTGTSYGRRDGWSIGYNKNFTVGIWVGNFSGEGSPELSGANTATPLLFKVFNTIDYDSNSEWYAPPPGLGWREVCAVTGLPPGPHCTDLVNDAYLPMISSTKACEHAREVKIAPDGSVSYCNACAPETGYILKVFDQPAPELQAYFAGIGRKFEKLPPHNPECEKLFSGPEPAIQSPMNGTEYILDRNDPEPIELKASASADAGRLFWYINDHFYKATRPGEKQFFLPTQGKVKISCTDDKGRNRDSYITVTYIRM